MPAPFSAASFKAPPSLVSSGFRDQFDTNVLGVLLTTREALGRFGPRGGSVINISTTSSINPSPNSTIYAASKAAVDTITLALAQELGPRGIRVNAIAPGGTETEGTRANGVVGSDVEKQIVAATPLRRFGQPDDIARVAVFLSSDQSAWVTGARITVSGGFR
ncbi:SDR family NAD(P)-dependent oxidoreductase [Shinella sp. BYT-45]|uniref:SDR family NAD(P)-dependent oxidoreductase n=1 Tax=Shinella sp. BYT-45 TaxID=3377377 RepID=UPI00397EE34A